MRQGYFGSWQRRLTTEATEFHRESLFPSVPLCTSCIPCGFPNLIPEDTKRLSHTKTFTYQVSKHESFGAR